jgi:hypothetical protein
MQKDETNQTNQNRRSSFGLRRGGVRKFVKRAFLRRRRRARAVTSKP